VGNCVVRGYHRGIFSRVPRRQKNVEHKLSPPPLQSPRAAHPPVARGRCRAEQWWSFIVSLVSSKRMTCSSAMYSDTATLTLKYHIWRITIRLGARGVRKNRSEKRPEDPVGSKFGGRRALAISCSGIVRGARFEILAPESEISISRREKFAIPPARLARIDRERVCAE